MKHLQVITLTGADERTDIDALVELVGRQPQVEIGLLYTATPEGRPRYPSRNWLETAARKLEGRCAVHVCGSNARKQLLAGELGILTRFAPRIQVNGVFEPEVVEQACQFAEMVITQHNDANLAVLGVQAKNHALLMDASGGRGIAPASWTPPETMKPVGFAGGLGPNTLAEQLPRIAQVAKEGSWVDMEGHLRVDDWFSVPLAAQCASIFTRAVAAAESVRTGRCRP